MADGVSVAATDGEFVGAPVVSAILLGLNDGVSVEDIVILLGTKVVVVVSVNDGENEGASMVTTSLGLNDGV